MVIEHSAKISKVEEHSNLLDKRLDRVQLALQELERKAATDHTSLAQSVGQATGRVDGHDKEIYTLRQFAQRLEIDVQTKIDDLRKRQDEQHQQVMEKIDSMQRWVIATLGAALAAVAIELIMRFAHV